MTTITAIALRNYLIAGIPLPHCPIASLPHSQSNARVVFLALANIALS